MQLQRLMTAQSYGHHLLGFLERLPLFFSIFKMGYSFQKKTTDFGLSDPALLDLLDAHHAELRFNKFSPEIGMHRVWILYWCFHCTKSAALSKLSSSVWPSGRSFLQNTAMNLGPLPKVSRLVLVRCVLLAFWAAHSLLTLLTQGQ